QQATSGNTRKNTSHSPPGQRAKKTNIAAAISVGQMLLGDGLVSRMAFFRYGSTVQMRPSLLPEIVVIGFMDSA
ncbi:MAG: hypothetical protein LBO00_08730, partial [Zoogloeaceae bacterium]|nr:hypothetical protein [Zoogloeaceae bacterium]